MDEKKIELSYASIYLHNLAIIFVVADTKLLLLNISHLISTISKFINYLCLIS